MGVRGILRDIVGIYLGYEIVRGALTKSFTLSVPIVICGVLHTLEAKGMVYYEEGGAYIPTEKGWRLLMSVEPVEEFVEAFGHPEISEESLNEIKIVKGEKVKDSSVIGVRA